MVERQFADLGDKLTTALISGDFGLYASIIVLPFKVTPRDAPAYVMHDLAELQKDFDLYHSIIQTHGVTDIYRHVRQIDLLDDNRALITCTTHIMVRAQRIVDPFETRILVGAHIDSWKIFEIESSEGHINWTLGRGSIAPDGRFST